MKIQLLTANNAVVQAEKVAIKLLGKDEVIWLDINENGIIELEENYQNQAIKIWKLKPKKVRNNKELVNLSFYTTFEENSLIYLNMVDHSFKKNKTSKKNHLFFSKSNERFNQISNITQKELLKIANTFNMILQKEYLIISPSNSHPTLSTESVRGCYVVCIYHEKRSGILHWDDNTEYSEINRFVNEFLQNSLLKGDSQVYLIGGWRNVPASKYSGEFLKQYFVKNNWNLNLDYYQIKGWTENTILSEEGFSLVGLNAKTGKILVNDEWVNSSFQDANKGKFIRERYENRLLLDMTHYFDETEPGTGTRIIARDNFSMERQAHAEKLCNSVEKNEIALLKILIDEGVINVNIKEEKSGSYPLHLACSKEHYATALLLIKNGADLTQEDEQHTTAYELIKNKSWQKKLKNIYLEVQNNKQVVGFEMAIHSRKKNEKDEDTDLSSCSMC